jgi:F-type H+-transporting ATPase subunit alpha
MREAAANVRLDLAQYADVKGFARFGALLDESTRRQLEHGQRLSVLLRQPERRPLPVLVQVAEMWALKTGLLDALPVEKLAALEDRLLTSLTTIAQLSDKLASAHGIDIELAAELARWVAAASA